MSIDPAPDSVASVPGAADGPFTVPEHLRAEQLQDRMGIELLSVVAGARWSAGCR